MFKTTRITTGDHKGNYAIERVKMKVEKKSYEQHPEGWFLFTLTDPEQVEADYKGRKSIRLKWPCVSNLKGEDGNHLTINLFTGMGLTDHPADLHRQLVEDGFGLDADDYEDTDEIVGQMFSGKVEHKKETGRAAIVKFDTKERCQKVKGKKRAEVDPFENE